MKKEQLSERIGNIDDRLVQEAERIPNYARQHRQKGIRRFSAIAAVFALMVCSFTVGAVAFAKETIVEVPVEQERIYLEEIGLTLILPDSWKGAYGVERYEDGAGCSVYVSSVHDGEGDFAGQGYLFWVGRAYDEPMTPEELESRSAVPSIYLFSTSDGTYTLDIASDVEYDPSDPEEQALYMTMFRQIQDISFQIDNPATIK